MEAVVYWYIASFCHALNFLLRHKLRGKGQGSIFQTDLINFSIFFAQSCILSILSEFIKEHTFKVFEPDD